MTTTSTHTEIRYVEFYAGVGGWTMAFEQLQKKLHQHVFSFKRAAALDHSDLCGLVFQHNFGSQDYWMRPIERITLQQAVDWKAHIWAMSPPCQPHTRQHDHQQKELQDPRSQSFLHLCRLLERMEEEALPRAIFLENVVGFEQSESCQLWRRVLSLRHYTVGHFHLTPTQVGVPNDRPRYYCVALRNNSCPKHHVSYRYTHLEQEPLSQNRPPIIHTSLGELGIQPISDTSNGCQCIDHYLEDPKGDDLQSLRIPNKFLKGNSAWCFDIVTPNDCRSSCFTHSYGKFIRGTGSVLYTGPNPNRFQLESPEEREFSTDWADGLNLAQDLRYFSGLELARLFDFSPGFSFPSTCTLKQQWKLLGNSLNVRVAARLSELVLDALLEEPTELQKNEAT